MIKIDIDQICSISNKPIRDIIIENHWKWFINDNYKTILESLATNYSTSEGKRLFNYLLDCSNSNKRLNNILVGTIEILNHEVGEIIKEFPRYFIDKYFEKDKNDLESILKKCPNIVSVDSSNKDQILIEIEQNIGSNQELINILTAHKIDSTVQKVKQTIRKIKDKIRQLIKNIEQEDKKLELEKDLLFQAIKTVFNYGDFTSSYESWGAYELSKKLDITVCPYCNRSFTHTLISKDGKTRPEFDHFYIKTTYPFLAVSLFNLVPSCHICNSNLKGTTNFYAIPHIYPYNECFGNDAVFKTILVPDADGNYPIDFFKGIGNEGDFKLNFEIRPGTTIEDKVKNSNSTFKITELYQFHKDYVLEIIKRTIFYNESRITELTEKEPYKKLFSGREEVVQILIGNYVQENKLGKRVLAKLTKDIWEEFRLDEVWKTKYK